MIDITDLFRLRCVYRASLCTASTVYAFLCVNNMDAISLSNSFCGALACTYSAVDAFFANFISHRVFLLVYVNNL